MNDQKVVERWFASVELDHPLMTWLYEAALTIRDR
jgi:hypothetical protein